MKLTDDIRSPILLKIKGGLFAILAVFAGVLTIALDDRRCEAVLLAICVWASCRFYYFLFYVLERYVGGDKNASLYAMLLKLFASKRQ